jgi:hypothetical protein
MTTILLARIKTNDPTANHERQPPTANRQPPTAKS